MKHIHTTFSSLQGYLYGLRNHRLWIETSFRLKELEINHFVKVNLEDMEVLFSEGSVIYSLHKINSEPDDVLIDEVYISPNPFLLIL